MITPPAVQPLSHQFSHLFVNLTIQMSGNPDATMRVKRTINPQFHKCWLTADKGEDCWRTTDSYRVNQF